MKTNWINLTMGVALSAMTLASCSSDDSSDDSSGSYSIPTTYSFERSGNSTVSYSGQTERKDQLAEMTTMMKTGNNGDQVDAQKLRDMYANVNDNGNGNFSFTSTKDLKSKTIEGETGSVAATFETFMSALEQASQSTSPGSNGQAGTVGGDNGQKGPYFNGCKRN